MSRRKRVKRGLRWLLLVACLPLLPTWLVSLRWTWFWSNATDREITLIDATLTSDFFHSGPPALIAQRLHGRTLPDMMVNPWWYEMRDRFLSRRFWFPTFRQVWLYAASLDSAGRIALWTWLPPQTDWSSRPGIDGAFRCMRYQIPLWPLALPALPALWVLSRDIVTACRTARRRRRGLCLHCGYNLTGNVSGRCPECGTPCAPQPIHAPTPQP